VASDITGKSATLMIDALIDGERRGSVLADLAIGRMRTAGKLADLSQALAGRFTEHHALLCQLHRDRIAGFDAAVAGLGERIAGKAVRWQRARQGSLPRAQRDPVFVSAGAALVYVATSRRTWGRATGASPAPGCTGGDVDATPPSAVARAVLTGS
jgi:hypothetical protein